MVIDFHTHAFPARIAEAALTGMSVVARIDPFTNGTTDDLISSMKVAGIALSLIQPVATTPKQVPTINRSAAEINETRFQDGLFSFGGIHPDCPHWKEELDEIAALGLKGVKLHPLYQGTDIDHPNYLRILERAGQLGLIVMTHSGLDLGFPGDVHCSPAMLRRAIQAVGPVKLVAAHMGGWGNWDEVMELLVDTPVYLDTSLSQRTLMGWQEGYYSDEQLGLLTPSDFMGMIRAFGTHRVLFGTDSPWTDQKASLEWLRALPLTPEERADILGGNARKLLNI